MVLLLSHSPSIDLCQSLPENVHQSVYSPKPHQKNVIADFFYYARYILIFKPDHVIEY